MNEELLLRAVARLNESIQQKRRGRCFIGFDGFTDNILSVVETRLNAHAFKEMSYIENLGHRISSASGKSTNIELYLKQTKLGGNAPILTQALLEGGHEVTFAGAIGLGEIEPLFQSMASRCVRAYPLAASGLSDALEFLDGKIILGKHQTLLNLDYDTLLKAVGAENLTSILDGCDLFVSANWTMLPMTNQLWKQLLRNHVTKIASRPRWMFVDLADPAKRTDEDLVEALSLLKQFQGPFQVILGLNQKEAERVAKLTGAVSGKEGELLAGSIRSLLNLSHVVLHSAKKSTVATKTAQYTLIGPYTPTPKLTTGAGDNFNAGYLNGILHKLSPEESLVIAVYTSGFYVRNGHSPTLDELSNFIAGQKSEAMS
jgi:hypothetical protein